MERKKLKAFRFKNSIAEKIEKEAVRKDCTQTEVVELALVKFFKRSIKFFI